MSFSDKELRQMAADVLAHPPKQNAPAPSGDFEIDDSSVETDDIVDGHIIIVAKLIKKVPRIREVLAETPTCLARRAQAIHDLAAASRDLTLEALLSDRISEGQEREVVSLLRRAAGHSRQQLSALSADEEILVTAIELRATSIELESQEKRT